MKKIFIFFAILLFISKNCFSETFISGNLNNFSSINRTLICCIGDSITLGTGDSDGFGYRNHLLNEIGINEYKLIGSKKNPTTNYEPYLPFHEGIGGETSTQIESRIPTILSSYLTPTKSKIILLHAGTNDISASVAAQDIVDNIEDIIDLIDAFDSSIDIYIALILPRINGFDSPTTSYNSLLATFLNTKKLSKTNLYIVDINSAFKNDTFGLCSGDWQNNCWYSESHPNDLGYQVMAKQWAACINNPSATNCNGN